MTNDDYIGYALDLLEPAEREAMAARLAAHPEDAALVERIRASFSRLEADRHIDLPADLADRTLARLDAELAIPSVKYDDIHDRPETRLVGGRFRLDLFVAAGIGFLMLGLGLSFVNRARSASDILVCQNNLRVLHSGLTGYADTHGGRFPQVGTEAYPTAGTFVQALTDAGQCPPGFHANCPAAPDTSHVNYAYALGHRINSNIVQGHFRMPGGTGENDLIPISADYPAADAAPGGGPTSGHRTGHNVLFVGGQVRFATTATVGINGDDIFRNQLGAVAAGVHRADTVLGRFDDVP
jgi:hypothetical protein